MMSHEENRMRAVLWDLDGTLAGTDELHFRAWRRVLADHGLDYDYAGFLADFGRNNSDLLRNLFGPQVTVAWMSEVAERKEAVYRALLATEDAPLLPGVADWLAAFQAEGVLQVVSSSGPMANIAAVIAKLGIGDSFSALMSGLRLPRGKPHPALFLRSAAAVGVTPADCIVIEDSLPGIEAARRAGMGCIAAGQIVANPRLDRLLAEVPGQPCLPVRDLTRLRWAQVEELWQAARSLDAVGAR
jgi:HAD superfamily hydrolase (TIGR01509 family)